MQTFAQTVQQLLRAQQQLLWIWQQFSRLGTLTRVMQQLLPTFQQLQRDGNIYSNNTTVTPTPSSSRVNERNIEQATVFTATRACSSLPISVE